MKDSENKLSGSMHSFKRMLSFGILMVIAMTLFAQVKNVSGVVLDKKGESIIGASVLVKGTTNGTITDFDGNFVLRNVADNAICRLVLSDIKLQMYQLRDRTILRWYCQKILKHWMRW